MTLVSALIILFLGLAVVAAVAAIVILIIWLLRQGRVVWAVGIGVVVVAGAIVLGVGLAVSLPFVARGGLPLTKLLPAFAPEARATSTAAALAMQASLTPAATETAVPSLTATPEPSSTARPSATPAPTKTRAPGKKVTVTRTPGPPTATFTPSITPTATIAPLAFLKPTLSATDLSTGGCGVTKTDVTESLTGFDQVQDLYVFVSFQKDVQTFSPFDDGHSMNKQFDGTYKVTLSVDKLKNSTLYDTSNLALQFIAVDKAQNILGRSEVFLVAKVTRCP